MVNVFSVARQNANKTIVLMSLSYFIQNKVKSFNFQTYEEYDDFECPLSHQTMSFNWLEILYTHIHVYYKYLHIYCFYFFLSIYAYIAIIDMDVVMLKWELMHKLGARSHGIIIITSTL